MNEQEEKLTELFRQYGASIHRMCFLYLKDYHLAEDAVSETFLKAYRALPSFRRDASPKTWLTRIAINICKSRPNCLSGLYTGISTSTFGQNPFSIAFLLV